MFRKISVFLLFLSICSVLELGYASESFKFRGIPNWLTKNDLTKEIYKDKSFSFTICDCSAKEKNLYEIKAILYCYTKKSNIVELFRYKNQDESFNHDNYDYNDSDIKEQFCGKNKSYIIYVWSFSDFNIDSQKKKDLRITSPNYTDAISIYDLDKIRLSYKDNSKNFCDKVYFGPSGEAYIQYCNNRNECIETTAEMNNRLLSSDETPKEFLKFLNEKKAKPKVVINLVKKQEKSKDSRKNYNLGTNPSIMKNSINFEGIVYYFFSNYGWVQLNKEFDDGKVDITKENYLSFFITHISSRGDIKYSPIYFDNSMCRFHKLIQENEGKSFLWKTNGNLVSPIGTLQEIDDNKYKLILKSPVKEIPAKYKQTIDKIKDALKVTDSNFLEIMCQDRENCKDHFDNLNEEIEKIEHSIKTVNDHYYIDDFNGNIVLPYIDSNSSLYLQKETSWILKGAEDFTQNISIPDRNYDTNTEKNIWGDSVKYTVANIYEDDKKRIVYFPIEGDLEIFKKYFVTKNELNTVKIVRRMEDIGIWIIVDDHLTPVGESDTAPFFREFKTSEYFCNLVKQLKASKIYRVDVISSAITKKMSSPEKICNSEGDMAKAEIKALWSLSPHNDEYSKYEWELHLFLSSVAKAPYDDNYKEYKDILKKLRVRRLVIWEFCEYNKNEPTRYKILFEKILDSKPKSFKYKIIYPDLYEDEENKFNNITVPFME